MAFRRLAIVAGLVWGGTAAAGATAFPPGASSARLIYERAAGAASCPDEATLRAAVARRVGFDPFEEQAKRVISCRVQRAGRVLRARIDVGDDADQLPSARELVSKQADCEELAEAIELALAIAVNPLIVATSASPKPAAVTVPTPTVPTATVPTATVPTATVATATVATRTSPPESTAGMTAKAEPALPAPALVASSTAPAAAATPRRHAFELRVGASAGAAAGLAPGLGYAGTVHLGLKRGGLSAALELRALAPSSSGIARGSLEVWQWAVLFAPCAHRGGWAACLVGSGGMVYGHSDGLAINGRSSGASAAAGARVAWEYPLDGKNLRFCATLDATAALVRTHFSVGGIDAWTAPPVGVVWGAGVQGAFF